MVRGFLSIGRMAAALAVAVALLLSGIPTVAADGDENPCAGLDIMAGTMNLPHGGGTDLNHVAFCIPAGTEGAAGCADHLKDEYGLEPVEGTDNQFEYTGEEELDPEAVLAEPGGERGQLVMSSSGLDVRINGAPSITEDGIRAWLSEKNPALLEADPDLPLTFYETSIEYNIDPAIALSFFQMESSYGKAGRATSTLSIGNIREYGDGPAIDGFRAYDTWSDGVEDYYQLLSGDVYVSSGLTTVEQIVPKYAPAADNNVPTQYINSVRATAEAIQQYEEVMGPDGGISTGSGGGARGCYPHRPTPRRLPDCPKMDNFDNVVDYLTEIEAMFDDMLKFYEPLVNELKHFRSVLFAEQAKCHGAINDFASRYGVPCEMDAFSASEEGEEEESEPEAEEDAGGSEAEPEEDTYEPSTGIEGDLHPEEEVTLSVYGPEVRDAHPLEALVLSDGFGPALCAAAVKDNCLADDAWQCRKGEGHLPAVVGTCSMCVAEGCWAGTGCGTCGEEDDSDDSEGEKKLTPVYTDGSSGTYPRSEDEALTGGTDPFGVKECKGEGLAEGERTYVVIERGVHANVEALELQRCQQAAIDVKDLCMLDGSGDFLGDGGVHGPTDVLVGLDDLIRDIESFVFDLGKLTDEVHKMAEETKKDLDGKDAINWPTAGSQTSGYGPRGALCADANLCKPHFHHGLDISQAGTVPVIAAADGKVSGLVKESSGSCYGNAVFLDHGNNLQTRYGHLRSLEVSMSQVVDQGQRIGLQGNTGCSTGQHLHFEIRVNGQSVDPLEVLEGKSNVFLLFHEAEIFSTMSKNAENIKPTQEALKAFVTFLREYTNDVCGAGGTSEGDVPSFLVGASDEWANGESCDVSFPPLFDGDDCTSTQDADTEEDPPEEEEEEAGTKPEESGEHLDDCPSEKHRGGCIATTTTTSVSDSNSDALDESIEILLSLAGWYPDELFLDDEKCFGYNTEGGNPSVSGSASPGGSPDPGSESFGTDEGAEDDLLPGQDAEEGDDDPLVQCCQRLFNTETVTGTGGAIAYTAHSWLGVAYALGGSDRVGVDGPGLVLGVMRENGFELPRTAAAQLGSCEQLGGMRIAWNVLRPGDLVFLKDDGSTDVSHTGVFVGDDLIVNAPGPEGVVRLDKLSTLRHRWSGGCRIGSSASSDAIVVSWCQEEVDELCCRGPGLELELAISEEACGMSCDELCDRKHTRHTVAHTLCRHACGARDEQCDGKTDESACEVDSVEGLCCEEKCMVHALMCASRVEVCIDIRDGEQCSFGGDDGICCGGRCLTGGGACTPCAVGPTWAKDPANGECEQFESVCDVPTGRTDCGPCSEVDAFGKDPATGKCERFDSPCDVPYGWSECEGHGCASLDDGAVCSIDGTAGICCGGGCTVGATSCMDDPTVCTDVGEGEACATDSAGVCCNERCAVGAVACGECPRAVTHAYDPSRGQCVRYDTPCDVPKGWPPCIASSCLTECQNAHPSNPALAHACREQCEGADISCEERCLAASDDTDERTSCIGQCSNDVTSSMPETLRYCETGCLSDDDAQTGLCMSMCRATHPHVNIELAIVRGEQEASSLFTGERPRLRIIAENRGSREFAGSIEAVLRELSACTCPACPSGDVCHCGCDTGERPVVRFDDVMLGVGKKTTYLSDPFILPATLAGTTLQPAATLRDASGRTVGAPRGPFYGVAAPGPVSIDDAQFTVDGRERATTAAPGSTATASLILTTARAPTSVTVSVVTAVGVPVEGTERIHELPFPVQNKALATGPLTVTSAQAGSLFRISYRIESGGVELAAGVLDEQGRPPGMCDGRELTTECEQLHLQAHRSYPHAFLEVLRPKLVATDASFMDADGREAILMPAGKTVRAMVELANPSGRPFTGTVTVSVTQEDGSTALGSDQTIEVERGLDGSLSRSFETASFQTTAGRSYRIRVLGKDRDGAVWLDEIVQTVLFPMAGLNVPESAVSGISRNDVFTSVDHEDCRAKVTCVQCLSTCELRVERTRCTVTPFNCDCHCTMEAIS